MRRIVSRGGQSPNSPGQSSVFASLRSSAGRDDQVGEQLASLLGVRSVFEVAENEFMRDKTMQLMTFGLAGKKGISDSLNLADTQVGTVWKPRILMVTMSSVCLFSTSEKKTTSPTGSGDSGQFNGNASGNNYGNLISKVEDLKLAIPMEDISHACQFNDPRSKSDFIVQIRSAPITGVIRTTLVRCKNQEDLDALMDSLEVGLKSYRSAIDYLRDGLIDDRSTLAPFSVSMVTQTSKTGKQVVLNEAPFWGDEISVRNLSQLHPVSVHVYGPLNGRYKATILPYMIKLALKGDKPVTIVAEPVACKEIDEENRSRNTQPLKPISLQIEVVEEKSSSFSSAAATGIAEEKKSNTDPESGQTDDLDNIRKTERALDFQLRETTIVALVCVLVATSLTLPDWCFSRRIIMTFLSLPVAAVMLHVRGKQHHVAIAAPKKKETHEEQDGHTATTDAAENYHCKITLIGAKEGVEKGAMSSEFTEETYIQRYSSTTKASALAAAGALGSSTRKISSVDSDAPQEGVDALISALSGAYDDTLTDADCPQKWFDATDGSPTDAIRQWKESLAWRRENDIDTVLSRPQPNFFVIKNTMPHCWLGLDNNGHLVTLEQFGTVKQVVHDLKAKGIGPEEFSDHCVFLNEYWIKNKITPTGRLNKIVDLKGFGVSQLSMEVINYFKPMNHAMQQYPELLIKVYIINAPSSFRFAWRIVSPLLAKKTTEKITVVSGNEKTLKEVLTAQISPDILLPEYGGTMSDEFKNIPVEIETANYIRKLNHNNHVESKEDWSPYVPEETVPLPMAVPVEQQKQSSGVADATVKNHAVIESLVGQWTGNLKLSESMDPVLELQGVSWIKRKAAANFTPVQSIEVTGKSPQTLQITTKTGPVITVAQGEINGKEGQSTSGNDSGDRVVIRTVQSPPHLQDRVVPIGIELSFSLANGDKRVVFHALDKNDPDTKVMSITYIRTKDEKSATVILVSKRDNK